MKYIFYLIIWLIATLLITPVLIFSIFMALLHWNANLMNPFDNFYTKLWKIVTNDLKEGENK